jgi:hypothetical protein
MRPEDSADALDRDDDGERAEFFGPETPGADPTDRADDFGVGADDDLLDADLGVRNIDLEAGPEWDLDEFEDLLDSDPLDDEDDEEEMALLQDLGLDDLGAPEGPPAGLGLGAVVPGDDSADDEVAA